MNMAIPKNDECMLFRWVLAFRFGQRPKGPLNGGNKQLGAKQPYDLLSFGIVP